MTRLSDIVLLAKTKLRTHRTRTGITVVVAGLLFGLIIAVVLVTQGVFESVGQFSSVGLNNKSIVMVFRQNDRSMFNAYEHRYDSEFVAEVEKTYEQIIATKKVAAKKYDVSYDPVVNDPSPIVADAKTKQKAVSEAGLNSAAAQTVTAKRIKAAYKPFDITGYIKPYSSAKVLGEYVMLMPRNGQLAYMKGGKETMDADSLAGSQTPYKAPSETDNPSLYILNQTVTQPFITEKSFDPSKGEIPVILPYNAAEKLLGLEPLASTAPQKDKLARLVEVRKRVGEITTSFCFRNDASRQLLATAIAQRKELEQGKADANYVAPQVQYAVPSVDSCGEVAIVKDMRTVSEKRQDANRVLFEKETGTYVGDPYQKKLIMRGVGITGSSSTGQSALISGTVQSLLSSWLGYDSWTIPEQLFGQLPVSARPSEVFTNAAENQDSIRAALGGTYLVDFEDKAQARALLEQTGGLTGMPTGSVYTKPFGSGTILVDEAKTWVAKILFWALMVVGAIAVMILGSIIGRTVSDGRRESAIFRAIGARWSDIVTIYGVYTALLSLRVAAFAFLLGGAIAIGLDLCVWQEATLGARVAYAASDTTEQFHLFGVGTWYLPAVVGVIVLVGILASLPSIVRNARRNPITDMRDE